MTYPKFAHHGAVNGVTGSCHRYIAGPAHHYLIDCGLFQGVEQEQADPGQMLGTPEIEFDISAVKALFVTHVHIDHIGRLPYLIAAGFRGPIYCSIPSARLLPLVIEDALKVGFTRDKALIRSFLRLVGKQLKPLDYGQWHPVEVNAQFGLRLKLQRAGHILGSAYLELDLSHNDGSVRNHRTVYSGDLGAPYAPLLPAPRAPYKADVVVIESTYGDKNHEHRQQRKQRLKQAVEHALANGGTVIVPAFSIGRTQELLYEFEGLVAQGDARWQRLQIIVDSPLAAKFTEVYRELKPYWDAEAKALLRQGRHPLSFAQLHTVGSHQEHQATVAHLAKTGMPAVVLAASGMANGGRVLNYLKAMLEDPRHAVLFVGYQARGTLGRTIQQYGPKQGYVDIDGQRLTIRAQVATISGYSAHADQTNLVNFIKRMRHWPRTVRIVHGDDEAKHTLAAKFSELGAVHQHAFELVVPKS